MSASISQDQPSSLEAGNSADAREGAKDWRPGNLGLRFLVAFIAAIATGIIAHEDWPGSIIAAICALPFALLFRQQMQQRFTFDGVITAAFTSIALVGVAIEPGPLNLGLFWLGLAAFAVLGQGIKIITISAALEVILRNMHYAPLRLFADAGSAWALKRSVQINTGWIANLVLPLLAITVFGTLLAISNPLIADFVALFSWSKPFEYLLSGSTPVAIASFLVLWSVMRMTPLAANLDAAMNWVQPVWHSRYFKLTPVIATLLLLNAMFAAQNALDYTYIWNGVSLPPGMSRIEYVHRGSYSLIATALLAGALIIAMFQPGSATDESSTARALVYVFAAQNLLLVASSAMRTMVYVNESGMTLWRISAFIWMGLVATGLALIAFRVMFNKTNLWLLNTNLSAALLVLLASGVIDYKSIVAEVNVSRALAKLPQDAQTQTTAMQLDLDVPYLISLGPSALPAFERLLPGIQGIRNLGTWIPQLMSDRLQTKGIFLAGNAHAVLTSLRDGLRQSAHAIQSDWRTWTLRQAGQ